MDGGEPAMAHNSWGGTVAPASAGAATSAGGAQGFRAVPPQDQRKFHHPRDMGETKVKLRACTEGEHRGVACPLTSAGAAARAEQLLFPCFLRHFHVGRDGVQRSRREGRAADKKALDDPATREQALQCSRC